MKQYIRRFLLFLAITALAVAIPALLIPDNAERRFQGPVGDLHKSAWIYNKILENKKIDVAFFGASYVLQSVKPELVSNAYDEKRAINVANFAMPFVGRDLEYIFIKEALSHKSPSAIVLQLRPTEGRKAHPVFAELAEKIDFMGQPLIPTFTTIDEFHVFAQRQVRMLTKHSFENDVAVYNYYEESNGFKKIDAVMPEEELILSANEVKPLTQQSLYWLEYYRARTYLEKIELICKKNKIKIFFLYLPSFKDHRLPFDLSFISKIGEVIYLPPEVITDPSLRSDYDHFNNAGAEKVSVYVGEYLKGRL